MKIFARPSEEAAKSLLQSCGLPIADLAPGHFEHFFACGTEQALGGVVGLEAHALNQGVSQVYLLTQTAESFFASIGYQSVNREEVPAKIRATKEYSGICPDSATVMRKNLLSEALSP